MKASQFIQFLLAFVLLGNIDLEARIIPSGRTIQWSPGLSSRGGIPKRTSLINVKDPPYRAKGDGKTDDTAAIQAALNAAQANQVVYLPAGTYATSSSLEMNRANVSIRGDGPSQTIIKFSGAEGIQATPGQSWNSPVAITNTATQGQTSITVASASGIAVGDIVAISETNPPYATAAGFDGVCTWCGVNDYGTSSGNDQSRLIVQLDKVVRISGNALTLERPLYLTYSNSPAIQDTTLVYGIGIENLQVLRVGGSGYQNFDIDMQNVAQSWIINCASISTTGTWSTAHFNFSTTYGCEIRECWAQGDPAISGSTQNLGVFLNQLNSEDLVEDNIMVSTQDAFVGQGSSGCVIGYNYGVGTVNSDAPDWLSADWDLHAAENIMMLFEGNNGNQLSFDNTWGGNAFNTAFRNWICAFSSANTVPTGNRVAIDLQANTYCASIVGCVLGRPGDASSTDYAKAPTVSASAYIHGNYCYVTGQTLWDATNSDHTLPASLYYGSPFLPAKPAWWNHWGTVRWPPIGPDLSPMTGEIPAVVRYNKHLL